MTSDLVRPPARRYNYSNAFTGLINLVRDEGLHGLTRGLGPNTVSTIDTLPFYISSPHIVSCSVDECALLVILPISRLVDIPLARYRK